jgi:hypothetical protein
MRGLANTIFAPSYTFVEEANSYERSSTDTVGTRVHAAANSWSVGVSGGYAWFKAGVNYRQSQETSITSSSRDFQGYIRLIKQRNFISLAPGHYGYSQDVQTRLAAAAAARQAQNWTALASERSSFEQVYGVGFVSEVVLGHSMNLRATCTETSSNSASVTAFGAEFSTPFASGGFSNSTTLQNASTAAGCTIVANGLGMLTNPTDIGTFYNLVGTFYSNLATPTPLWGGCVEYRELPGFGVMYDPIPGLLNPAVDTPVVSQALQIPVLGAVGELVSLGGFAPNPADSVWMAPYLFPGDYTTVNGNLNLNVRIFDIYKQLSRDQAFRQTGDIFLAARGYPEANAAKPAVMPESAGGPSSTFVEHAGAYYKTNVSQIRPVLGIVDPVTAQVTTVLQSNAHWQNVSTMGLEGFGGPGAYGGPGSNACGLFLGAGSLTFSFADTNGDAALAAQQGRLRMFTEVARGATSVRLVQSKLVTGQFNVDVWDPSLSGIPDWPNFSVVYPGNKKVVLIRWPVQFDLSVGMATYAGPQWANSVSIMNWAESQDILWTLPGYYCGAYWRIPVAWVVGPTQPAMCPGVYPATTPNRGFLNPAAFGPGHGIALLGNGITNTTNIGSYQCILLLGQ